MKRDLDVYLGSITKNVENLSLSKLTKRIDIRSEINELTKTHYKRQEVQDMLNLQREMLTKKEKNCPYIS